MPQDVGTSLFSRVERIYMSFHFQSRINEIVNDKPNLSANVWQEGLGVQAPDLYPTIQYQFQSFNFRGNAIPCFDLIQHIGQYMLWTFYIPEAPIYPNTNILNNQ